MCTPLVVRFMMMERRSARVLVLGPVHPGGGRWYRDSQSDREESP